MKKLFYIILCSMLSLSLVDCTNCSRSGRNSLKKVGAQKHTRGAFKRENTKITLKMTEKDGVYMVPIYINDTKMNFIFDTGASDITISATEARFLYKQGTLTEEDVLGTQSYQIADGSISEGTIINLRTVQIGGETLTNIKASVIHNRLAPLLLGQSALAKFGKVSIDYNNKEIIFEKY